MGQCEVFVCLGFVEIISFLYCFRWPRSSLVRKRGVNSLKRPIVLATLPLRVNPLESRRVAYDSEDGYEFPYPGFEGLKSHRKMTLLYASVSDSYFRDAF